MRADKAMRMEQQHGSTNPDEKAQGGKNQIKPTCTYVDAALLCFADEVAQKAPHQGTPPSGKKEETQCGLFCDGAQNANVAVA